MHGTAIAVAGRAVLIRGRSGSGKSDLALRCLFTAPDHLLGHLIGQLHGHGHSSRYQAHQPVTPLLVAPLLVADDQVEATVRDDRVVLRPPSSIAGLIEVRGVGICRLPFAAEAELALVADLVAAGAIERLPSDELTAEVRGRRVPRILIAPFEASAPFKLLLALLAKSDACEC